MFKILSLKENELYGILIIWLLFNIFIYNQDAFIFTIISISASELVLIFIDYVNSYTKKYLVFIQYEKDHQE